MKEDNEKEEEISLELLVNYHAQLNELYEQNINLRMKYPTDHMRFYQSEEQIDAILQSLQVSGQEHIPLIIQSKILGSILKLLNHPNADINIACIELLHDMVSEEPEKDSIFEMYYRMCVWLVENGLYDCLVETLNKMNEEESVEQYEVSLQILKIIETLTEQIESSIESLVAETKLVQYLANRIMPNYLVKHKVIDDNKFVGSDILAFLLSNSQQAQLKFHKLCGMEILIESIRPYLSKEPANNDQKEYAGNLFDCLNIILINGTEAVFESKVVYLKMKGNELMLAFLKTKNDYSHSALKAIANSFTSLSQQMESGVIEELIDFGCLKYLFPILMRQGVKGQDIDEQMVIDENCLRIILIMIVSTSQIYRMRVEAKLTEKRFVKLEKLFEIRHQYMQNMGKQALREAKAEEYFVKLKQGLGVVEVIDIVICTLIVSTSTVRQKLVVLMKLYGVQPVDIEFILKTKYSFIVEGPEKNSLERLLAENVPLIHQMTNKQQKQAQ